MIVCQCNGVSARTVRMTVRNGAWTPAEVARQCGAGACCGSCRPLIRQILKSERERAREADSEASLETAPGTPETAPA
jgi:bacterioferritin-associated ferredoxin